MSQTINFRCAACSRLLSAQGQDQGQVVQCPCGRKLQVPMIQSPTHGTAAPLDGTAAPPFGTAASSYGNAAPPQGDPNPFNQLPAKPSPYHSGNQLSQPSAYAPTPAKIQLSANGRKLMRETHRNLIYCFLAYVACAICFVIVIILQGGAVENPQQTDVTRALLGIASLVGLGAFIFAGITIQKTEELIWKGTTKTLVIVLTFLPTIIAPIIVLITFQKARELMK